MWLQFYSKYLKVGCVEDKLKFQVEYLWIVRSFFKGESGVIWWILEKMERIFFSNIFYI